jgi:hypothetical protein
MRGGGAERERAAQIGPALKGWANVGCRCATAIVQTAQRSWARIGEPCGGRITLGWERGCLDRRKGLRTFHAARNGGVLGPRFCPRETSVRVVLTRTMVSSVSSRRTTIQRWIRIGA